MSVYGDEAVYWLDSCHGTVEGSKPESDPHPLHSDFGQSCSPLNCSVLKILHSVTDLTCTKEKKGAKC